MHSCTQNMSVKKSMYFAKLYINKVTYKNKKVLCLMNSVSVNENVFGHAPGGLINPLEKLPSVGGALEIKSLWVVN